MFIFSPVLETEPLYCPEFRTNGVEDVHPPAPVRIKPAKTRREGPNDPKCFREDSAAWVNGNYFRARVGSVCLNCLPMGRSKCRDRGSGTIG